MRITLINILLFSIVTFAQISVKNVNSISKFGMAGGVIINYNFLNISSLNNELENSNFPVFEKEIPTFGGAGYTYVLFVKNLRLGGLGFGGSRIVSEDNRSAKMSVSGGGLTIEYTFPEIHEFALSVGSLIGAGKMEYDIVETSGNIDWNTIWSEFNGDTLNKHLNFYNTYFFIMPTLNIEFLLNRFIALRFGTSYQISLYSSWKAYDSLSLSNVPSDVSGNGFMITVGILMGLFVF